VHDQSITAISKDYHRSVTTQIDICAHRRRVLVARQRRRDNRNDIIVTRRTVVQLLNDRVVLGDADKPTDRQIPRQYRRRGHAINHSRQIIAELWTLKTQLRVNS
jgi:hypothetical protein